MRAASLLLALVLGILAGPSIAAAFTPGEETKAVQPELVTRGAIVMLGPDPRIHVNVAHTSLGHPELVLEPGYGQAECYATILFDSNPGERILNISATPDDKMVWQGMTVGVGGGNGKVWIRLYRRDQDGRNRAICANDPSIDPATNVWLMTTVAP